MPRRVEQDAQGPHGLADANPGLRTLSGGPLPSETLEDEKEDASGLMVPRAVSMGAASGNSRELRDGWWIPVLLGLAFLFFGFALGEITGMSVTQGISQTLLTSVFTFVGGVMLTYAGFRRVTRESGSLSLDPTRVGSSLLAFSLGVGTGVPAGVYARCNTRAESFFLGQKVDTSRCLEAGPTAAAVPGPGPGPGIGPMAGAQDRCSEALKVLNIAIGEPDRDATTLHRLVSKMIAECSLKP